MIWKAAVQAKSTHTRVNQWLDNTESNKPLTIAMTKFTGLFRLIFSRYVGSYFPEDF